MQEQIDASKLFGIAVSTLGTVDPEHEILKFIISDDVSDDEYKDRFWRKDRPWRGEPGSMVGMVVNTNIYLDIKNILKTEHAIEI